MPAETRAQRRKLEANKREVRKLEASKREVSNEPPWGGLPHQYENGKWIEDPIRRDGTYRPGG